MVQVRYLYTRILLTFVLFFKLTGIRIPFRTSLSASNIMDLCDDVSTSSNLVEEEGGDPMGKKRKHCSNTQYLQQPSDESLFKAYNNTSSDGKATLVILKQPEKQHRARYHTEGSRGAVKDRAQSSFPTVQLRGYNPKKLAVLQVFVGSDTGTPIPHLYYQACKVSGKNSTPCREMKKENTGPSMSLPKQFYTIQYTALVRFTSCIFFAKNVHWKI